MQVSGQVTVLLFVYKAMLPAFEDNRNMLTFTQILHYMISSTSIWKREQMWASGMMSSIAIW